MQITETKAWYDSVTCFYKSFYRPRDSIVAKVIFCDPVYRNDFENIKLVNVHENFIQSRCIYAIEDILTYDQLKNIVMKHYIGLEETENEKHFFDDSHDFDRLYKMMMSSINNTEKKRADKYKMNLYGVPGIKFSVLKRWKYHLKLRELQDRPKRWDGLDPYEFTKMIHQELQNI
jgi:hypothetical protein